MRLDAPNGWYAIVHTAEIKYWTNDLRWYASTCSIHNDSGAIKATRRQVGTNQIRVHRTMLKTAAALLTKLAYPNLPPPSEFDTTAWLGFYPDKYESSQLDDARLMAKYQAILEKRASEHAKANIIARHAPVRLEHGDFVVDIVAFEHGRVRVVEKKILTRGEFEQLVAATETEPAGAKVLVV